MQLQSMEKSIRKMGIFRTRFEFLGGGSSSISVPNQSELQPGRFVVAFLGWVHLRHVPYWQVKWKFD
jgi:hypothetical protein